MNRKSFCVDRMATLHVSVPLRRILNTYRVSAVPVLMYHSISDPDNRFYHPYFETCTSSLVFEEHMKYLSENGYSSIGLNELPDALKNGNNAGKFMVLTFDDGNKDFLDNAFPIMDKYGFTATVFLATGMMGSRKSKFGGKEILDWNDVRELRKQGVNFGSHTVNHRILKKLAIKEIETEVGESKKEIESRLGEPVESFSYPYAFPEGRADFLMEYFGILDRCGYRYAVTTVIGRVVKGDNLLALKRLPVNEHDDSVFFKAKLDGAYDWVHIPQYILKKCAGWIDA